MIDPSRRAAAVHEAAHAVIADRLKLGFGEAWIELSADGVWEGQCLIYAGETAEMVGTLPGLIKVATYKVSGVAAESILLAATTEAPDPLLTLRRRALEDPGNGDVSGFDETLKQIGRISGHGLSVRRVDGLLRKAWGMVERERSLILAVADHLERHGHLADKELDQIKAAEGSL